MTFIFFFFSFLFFFFPHNFCGDLWCCDSGGKRSFFKKKKGILVQMFAAHVLFAAIAAIFLVSSTHIHTRSPV